MIALSLIHISEHTRLLSISYAVFCLKKKKETLGVDRDTLTLMNANAKHYTKLYHKTVMNEYTRSEGHVTHTYNTHKVIM